MEFCIVGKIVDVQTIAEGSGSRELALLRQRYGVGHWRKKKGIATVRLLDGTPAWAKLHW